MKKYDLSYRMSDETQAKVDALFAALRAAEQEEIELIEVQPRVAAKAKPSPEIGGNAD